MSRSDQVEVVVGVNGTGSSLHAVKWAAAEAANRRGRLRLVHAWTARVDAGPRRIVTEDMTTSSEAVATKALEVAAAVARTVSPGLEVGTELVAGAPALVLSAAAREANLLVLGARGPGVCSGAVVGSVAAAVAGIAPCAVVIVRGPAHQLGPVVVGVDGSDGDASVLAAAFDRAERSGTSVLAIHAWPATPRVGTRSVTPGHRPHEAATRMLDRALAPFTRSHPGVGVDTHVVAGTSSAALVLASAGAQLVVVGSPASGDALRGLLAASCELHHVQCPVEVIPRAA